MFWVCMPDGTEREVPTEDALVELVHAGVVTEETLVRTEGKAGQAAWRLPPLQNAFGLAVAAPTGAPTASPASVTGPGPAGIPPKGDTPVPPSTAPVASVGSVTAGGSGSGSRRGPNWPVVFGISLVIAAITTGWSLLPRDHPTRDGKMVVTTRAGWHRTESEPTDELMLTADGTESVVLVGKTEISADEPPMTLDAFEYSLTQDLRNRAPDFEDLGLKHYEAHGLQFLRHEFRATLNGRRGLFVLTNTKTRDAFYRISAATAAPLEGKRKGDLETISASLRPR